MLFEFRVFLCMWWYNCTKGKMRSIVPFSTIGKGAVSEARVGSMCLFCFSFNIFILSQRYEDEKL